MPLVRPLVAISAALAAASLHPASLNAAPPLDRATAPVALAVAQVVDTAGAQLGTARIIGGRAHPTLTVDLTGLPPGVHGMHLHTTGSCANTGTGAAFADASGHLNPARHEHGSLNPRGSHLGDLPNLNVAANGEAHATIELAMTAGALKAAVIDQDGTALVVHAGPDDYRTDPAGGSGARIACGVFMPR